MVMKWRMIRLAGRGMNMEVMNWYEMLVTKPQGKKPYGRPRYRWRDNYIV
jgi:hypothetical protein